MLESRWVADSGKAQLAPAHIMPILPTGKRDWLMTVTSHILCGVQLPWTETGMSRRGEAKTVPLAEVF